MEIKLLGYGDGELVTVAAHLFDGPPIREATRHFLAMDGHHLLIAYEGDHAAGYVSGVEMTHPDKGTEMFLHELAVETTFQRRGIGRALVERLRALARERGCYGMWVLTDAENAGARSVYEHSGGSSESGQVVIE